MRYLGYGINWQWYHTDTREEAVMWFEELTGKKPEDGQICKPVDRDRPGKFDDKYGFRIHR